MKNLKRVLSLVLATVMVIGMMVVGASAADYKDADKIDYAEAVDVMSAVGMIEGYDGNFAPEAKIDRAGATKLITYLMLGTDVAKKLSVSVAPFEDVPADAWYAPFVAFCAEKGLLEGYNGKFYPNGDIDAYGFAKLLLGALGYRADIENLTGDAWQVNTATLAIQNGLFNGNDAAFANQAMTREEACLYAFNALKAVTVSYTGGTNVTLPGGTTVTTGATRYEKTNADKTKDYRDVATDRDEKVQLCEALYPTLKLDTAAAVVDTFGRPAYSWSFKTKPVAKYVASEPVKTYTKGFNTAELTALGKAGYTFSVAADDIYVNGTNGALNGGLNSVDDIADREYTGTTVELYSTDSNPKTIEKIIVTQSYLAEVTTVVTGSKTAANDKIVLSVYNPWTGSKISTATFTKANENYDKLVAKYAEGDFLLTYFNNENEPLTAANFISAEDVSSTVATVTMKKLETTFYSGTIVADGATYTMASAYAEYTGKGGDLTLGKEYTLYFDANGYVMGAVPVDNTVVSKDYVYVLAMTSENNGTTANGDSAVGEAYINVKYVAMDGTAKVVKVAAVGGTNGNQAFSENDTAKGVLAKDTWYTVKADADREGFSVLTKAATVKNGTLNGDDLNKAQPVITTDVVANAKTVFVLQTAADTYATYTGIANVPSYTDATGVTAKAIVNDGYADVVFMNLTGKTPDDAAGGEEVYYLIDNVADGEVYDAATENTYFLYDAMKDGEIIQIKSSAASGALTTGLVTIKSYDADGYVSATQKFSTNVTDKPNISNVKVSYSEPTLTTGSTNFVLADDVAVYVYNTTTKVASVGSVDDLVGTMTGDLYLVAASGSDATISTIYFVGTVG